jgi:hypothetical protein
MAYERILKCMPVQFCVARPEGVHVLVHTVRGLVAWLCQSQARKLGQSAPCNFPATKLQDLCLRSSPVLWNPQSMKSHLHVIKHPALASCDTDAVLILLPALSCVPASISPPTSQTPLFAPSLTPHGLASLVQLATSCTYFTYS